MPVLFRLLMGRFLLFFLLSGGTLLGLIFTTRFHEIAQFAALGGGYPSTIVFILYQIPYILPVVVPIASALSAFFLFRDLSNSNGATSLRASGLSLVHLILPILMVGTILSSMNLLLSSEIATRAKLESRLLERNLKGRNPLPLLKQKNWMKWAGIEMIPLGPTDSTTEAHQLIVAFKHPLKERIFFTTVDSLRYKESFLSGNYLSSIMYGARREDAFSDFLIESSQSITTETEPLASLFLTDREKIAADFLTTKQWIREVEKDYSDFGIPRYKLLSEGFRRISLGLAPLSFALLGAATGLDFGRQKSRKPMWILFSLGMLSLTSFFLAKSLDKNLWLSSILYLLPHPTLVLTALKRMRNISRGIV